jgi:DNA helicase-2/ATP-dependent DNA helicase PcrA
MEIREVLEGLNDAQRAAVTSPGAPLCILAGAGSGKTRVLTRRIAWRVAQGDALPSHVLALTFTRKAAGELGSRLGALGIRDRMAAGTFHGVAYAQLRRRWADRDERPPAILDSKVRILAGLLPRRGGDRAVQPADVAGEIEWARARMVGPDGYATAAERAGRRPPLAPTELADVFERYEQAKRKRGVVDFEDLLEWCARAMEEDAEFASASRWRFRHLFVDEFQDVNPAQFRLLTAWLGDRLDLCVVGDPNQAIYSWNGADPTLLKRFPSRFPTAEVVRLEDNYRSSPQVLGVAAAVLAGRAVLRPNRPDGPCPQLLPYRSDDEEARGVARLARQAHRPGTPWSDIAVLARTNAQLPVLERAMRAVQVPCRVAGGGAFLAQPEIRDALARLAAAPPGMGFTASLADIAEPAGHEDTDGIGGAGPRDSSTAEERRLQLLNLVELGREYAAMDQTASADGFRAWLVTTLGGEGREGTGDAVVLATFHRAKGLEWPTVVLAGLERGLVPIGRAADPAAEAEERRLLYVAVTRARERLFLTWAERRRFGERSLSRSPSPYLEAVETALLRMQGHPVPAADAAGRIRAARSQLPRPRAAGQPALDMAAGADPEVLGALRQWRSATAKASGMPAYVIFHDTTLAALACTRPSTPEQLLAVPGLGPVKVDRYGTDLLALLADFGTPA